MNILIPLLMVLEAIVCFMLIGIVLIQRSKGQGVGLSFGGGAEAMFGAQMGNILTRVTVILGIVFLVNTAILAVLKPSSAGKSIVERAAVEAVAVPEVAAPVATDATTTDMSDVLETSTPEVATPVEAPAVEVPVAEVPAVEVPAAPSVEVPATPAVEVPAAD